MPVGTNSNSPPLEIPLKCTACRSDIPLLSKGKPDDIIVNAGGTILNMGVDLYQGVICENCRKTWCSGCWVTMMIDDKDICPTCGVRLLPLTSSYLKL